MRRSDVRLQHLSNTLAIGTGAVYAWAKYFARSSDPYSNSGSAWEPFTHNFHIVVVPLLVFSCGLIWHSHIFPMIKSLITQAARPGKKVSGLLLVITLLPMVLTGYLLQITVDESWRRAWIILHWVTSALWSLGYAVHILIAGGGTISRLRMKRTERPL